MYCTMYCNCQVRITSPYIDTLYLVHHHLFMYLYGTWHLFLRARNNLLKDGVCFYFFYIRRIHDILITQRTDKSIPSYFSQHQQVPHLSGRGAAHHPKPSVLDLGQGQRSDKGKVTFYMYICLS